MNILVFGGAGFIGTNYVIDLVNNKGNQNSLRVIDSLTYAGSFHAINSFAPLVETLKGDICDFQTVKLNVEWADLVINFAAESHVDRSINGGEIFVKSNTLGAQNIFEVVSKHKSKKLIHISTDEVYGTVVKPSKEIDPLLPNSPYAASKAAADLLARSYFKTFDLNISITRSCNNFGPFQYPEKFIPLSITNLLRGLPITIYGDGKNLREWIFVKDNCEAINTVIQSGASGEVYNIGSGIVLSNIDLARKILSIMGLPDDFIKFIPDRLGHDLQYTLDSTKISGIGFRNKPYFEDQLSRTIEWYKLNPSWWQSRIM